MKKYSDIYERSTKPSLNICGRDATYNITADYYSHLDFRSKMASADTISKLLDGDNLNGDTENNGSGSNPDTENKTA